MNIVTYLQELDNLIIEHTEPPVTPKLRDKLSVAMEQAEAHASAVEKQDQTLSRQLNALEQCQIDNEKLISDNKALLATIEGMKQQPQRRRLVPDEGYGDTSGLV